MIPIVKMTIESPETNRKLQGHRKTENKRSFQASGTGQVEKQDMAGNECGHGRGCGHEHLHGI